MPASSTAYLFSRFPVVSQTFCDTEMLALEAAGRRLVIGSLNPPPNSFRHERLARLRAEVIYPPPAPVLDAPSSAAPPEDPVWQAMATLAEEHEAQYGASFKSRVRARNAWHFAREFKKRGVTHVHVHFANRATHTALFLKKAGFSFSFTAHAQDFMVDLGNDDLLREMIRGATFTAAVSDFSRGLLVRLCPDAADRIHRVYNGIDPSVFPSARPGEPDPVLRLVSIGRLIGFKGFPVLIEAVALLRDRGLPVSLRIIGGGPLHSALEQQIGRLSLHGQVTLTGVLSQEEIKRELASAHAFALACLTDSKGATDILPTVILEAMACGLPVVSTTLAGVPEMVLHGTTGLLAPPADAAALATHLATLAADPGLRAAYGQAGLSRVREVFSLGKTAGHLVSLMPPQTGEDPPAPASASASASAAPGRQEHTLALLDAPGPRDDALRSELRLLATDPTFSARVTVLAVRSTPPFHFPPATLAAPAFPEYLPDATVLEAAWRSHPSLVSQAETLRAEAGPVDGEVFYQCARRAVHLATQAATRGWTRLHALRAGSVLTIWLLARLTGLPATAAIEAGHRESRAVLTRLLPAFAGGSCSDPKLKSPFPDLLGLAAPPPPRRLLGFRLPARPAPPADPAPAWRQWTGHRESSGS